MTKRIFIAALLACVFSQAHAVLPAQTATVVAPALLTAPARVTVTAAGGTNVTFAFKTTISAHIEVFLDGAKESTGYSVTLNANQDSSPGGTVVFTSPPIVGTKIVVQRTVPLEQPSVWTTWNFNKPLAAALDNLGMQTQQIDRKTGDAVSEAGRASTCAGDRLAAVEAAVSSYESRIAALDSMRIANQGPPGVQGPPGPTGATGLVGATGPVGPAMNLAANNTWTGTNTFNGTVLLPAGLPTYGTAQATPMFVAEAIAEGLDANKGPIRGWVDGTTGAINSQTPGTTSSRVSAGTYRVTNSRITANSVIVASAWGTNAVGHTLPDGSGMVTFAIDGGADGHFSFIIFP